ncbi:MAG: class I SAM-dependent methyltransferase [Synergistales bacterium]|nr:class I SAM-dependent methyltransferase [Synergistales bacterium]
MEGMEYLYELFGSMPRGGPGNKRSTRRAFELIPALPGDPFILDIGCGHGVQTLELAHMSGGRVIALDNHHPFLDILMEKAREEGLDDRIEPVCMSMLEMDFEEGTFDLIWSEGALYNMGFPEGLRKGRTLLKEDGYMAVSELTILSKDAPDPVMEYCKREYPPIRDVQGNLEMIRAEGFHLVGHFTLDSSAWLECFYEPMEKELERLEGKYRGNETALGFFEEMRNEIYMYRKYGQFYGYEFFVMQKRGR